MQVSKWGNSLAVRLPKKLVEAMALKPGDDVNLVALGGQELGLSKVDKRRQFLDKIKEFNWPLPEGYKFDREEANKR